MTQMYTTDLSTGKKASAPIVPPNARAKFPTHVDEYGLGGWQSVATLTDRDAIKDGRRKLGMAVFVLEDRKTYTLLEGFTNDNWVEHPSIKEGKSAYQIAVDNGFEGTEAEWITSLKGEDGKSAYELALAADSTIGTEAEWIESLKGDTGLDGKSAYQIAVDNGFTGTEAEWLESLKGQGSQSGGLFNSDNLTATAYSVSAAPLTGGGLAYVVKVARLNADSNTELFSVKNGGICCHADGYVRVTGVYTIASSVPAGLPDYAGIYIARNDDDVYSPNSGTFFKNDTSSTVIPLSCNGLLKVSANDIVYLKGSARTDCNVGSAAMCINYIGGAVLKSEGTTGVDGKSAYQIAVDNGFEGTEAEWLESLNAKIQVGNVTLSNDGNPYITNNVEGNTNTLDFQLPTVINSTVISTINSIATLLNSTLLFSLLYEGNTNQKEITITGVTSTDKLFIVYNGITLKQGDDYTVSDNKVTLSVYEDDSLYTNSNLIVFKMINGNIPTIS